METVEGGGAKGGLGEKEESTYADRGRSAGAMFIPCTMFGLLVLRCRMRDGGWRRCGKRVY